MIGKGSKKNRLLFKNIVFSAVLLSVIVSSVTIAPKRALAVDDDMSDVFPPSTSASEVGTGLPSNIPTTASTAYVGYNDSLYVVSNGNLKIDLDATKLASGNTFTAGRNASFWITINLGGESNALNDINGNGTADDNDELGSWHAIYSTGSGSSQPNGMPASVSDSFGDHGMWLEIGTSVFPQVLAADSSIGGPPIMPGLGDGLANQEGNASSAGEVHFYKAIPLDPVINFTLNRNQRIPITVGAGLVPNTQYYARIRLEEVNTPSEATSNIVSFRTGSDTSASTITTDIAVTEGQAATGSADNAGLILMNVDCGVNPLTWVTGCLVHLFYFMFYIPSSWLLMGAGWLLDSALLFSISTKIYSDPTIITFGWKIVRDVANIFFIFVLIYAAIKMILGDKLSDTKTMLANIILFAVLINFSLFFTKVVVDSSNILARIFYRQIQITGTPPQPITDISITGVEPKSLSQALTDGLNVNKMLSVETIQKLQSSGEGSQTGYIFLVVILAVIVNLVAAWTFFICALLFIGRIVGLWVTMIFSAFAFMSNIFPNKLKMIPMINWGEWLDGLLKMSFLAPIFLFFIYIIIKFVGSGFLDGLFLSIATFNWSQFLIAIILQFAILIVLIKQSKKLAEKLAGELGGSVAASVKGVGAAVGGFAMGAAVAVATGGVGAIGRATLGRGGASLAESQALKNAEAKGGIRGWASSKLRDAGKYMGGASYDVRNTSGFKSAMSSGKDLIGYEVKAGAGQKGGYVGAIKDAEKYRMERAKSLKTKLSAEQLKFTDPENVRMRDEYKKKQAAFNKQEQAFNAERSLASQQEFADKRFSSSEEERKAKEAFIKQYNEENPRPIAPTPPKYNDVSPEQFDKKTQEKYIESVQERTLNARLQKASKATARTATFGLVDKSFMGGGAGRTGELAAAKKLAGDPKKIKQYEAATTQLTNEIKNLTKKIEARNEEFKGNTADEIASKVNEKIANTQVDMNTAQARLESMQKKFNETAEGTPGRPSKAEMAAVQLEKNKHEAELENLKNLFKLDEQRDKKEESLKKIKEKLPWQSSDKGGEKEDKGGEKKEDKH